MLDGRQVREHFPTFESADLRTNELEVQALNLDTRPRSRLASLSAHHWADMEAAVTLINGSASLMDCARCYVRTWKGAVKPILLTTAAEVLADGRNG
jgi:hypothetical protein